MYNAHYSTQAGDVSAWFVHGRVASGRGLCPAYHHKWCAPAGAGGIELGYKLGPG